MPAISRCLIRTGAAWLVAGMALGVVAALPAELLIVGWLVQLAIGVGFWILPPVRGGAVRKRPARTVAGLLNAGILLFVVGSLAGGSPAAGWMLAAGRALEAAAVAGFGVPLMRRAWR